MKVTFENNSSSGLHRSYRKPERFELLLPGRTKKTVDVPEVYHDDLLSHIRRNYPAVVITPEQIIAPLAPVAFAAISGDSSIIDINVDDQDGPSNDVVTTVATTVEGSVEAPVEGSVTEGSPAPAPVSVDGTSEATGTIVEIKKEEPAPTPEAPKKGGASNLKPAAKGKSAKKAGGA